MEALDVLIRSNGRTGQPPIIRIKRLIVWSSLFGLFYRRKRIQDVRVEGLEICLPQELTVNVVNQGIRDVLKTYASRIDEVSRIPVSGNYTLGNVDLSHVKGLWGTLSSKGDFKGTLSKLEIDGCAKCPDFNTASGEPVSLDAEFHAVVDVFSRDIRLEPVHVRFGGTTIDAFGQVSGSPKNGDPVADLCLTIERGRLEDLLPLVISGRTPPMAGAIDLQAKLTLSRGPAAIAERLSLTGTGEIDSAKFTSPDQQKKLEDFSARARGHCRESSLKSDVLLKASVEFSMANRILSFSKLSCVIPGGSAHVTGRYLPQQDILDFRGHLLIQAKLSEVTTGLKSLLLKLIDPFFRVDGWTSIPIKIAGSRQKPSARLDL